jgi:hypothetical protein
MTEYAGYIAVNPVDWSKVAREATKDIMAIEDERQKKREELDALSVAGQEEINKWTKSADSDMNNVLMAGAQSARSYIQAQNDLLKRGMITPEEYKRNIANVKMNFSLASRNVSSFGDNIAKHEEMVLNGTASDQQIQNMKMYSKYTTMRNASIEIGGDGNVFMKDTDSKDGAIIPMGALSDPSNFFSKRIELAKYSDNFLKTLGLEKRYVQGRDIYIKSERLTDSLIEEGVDGLLGEDVNKYANVLTTNATDENGKILYTFDPEEAKRMNKTLINQELGKDGKYYAILSDKQKQEARNVVRSSIMDRVTTEESGFGTAATQELRERSVAAQEKSVGIRSQAESRKAREQTEEQKTANKNYNMKLKMDDFWKVNGQGSEFWKQVSAGKKSYGILDMDDFVDSSQLNADILKSTRIGKVFGNVNTNPSITLVDMNGNEIMDANNKPAVFQIKGGRKYNISARYWNATHTGTDYTGKEIENATKPGGQTFGPRSKASTSTPAP